MEQAGQRRIIRAEDVAVMGITEILRHIPHIYRSYRKLVASLKTERPAVAILIDFPDVNFRLAKHCRRLHIPVLWLVSPQLWAWKRSRLRWVQKRVDRMLVIFPFEAAFYLARNVEAEFIGHPLATLPAPTISRTEYAAANMFANPDRPETSSHIAKPWIALLPGSRWKEVTANLPTMLKAAASLGPGYDFLIPVASTLDGQAFSDLAFKSVLPQLAWPTDSSITFVPDARAALHHSVAAVIASGTATVQALTIGNPFLVVYRVSPLTYWLAKRLIRYPAEIPAPPDAEGHLPIAMVNLIAGRRIVPELINHNFTAQKVAETLRPLLTDTPTRRTMLADLAEARRRLLPTPIEGRELSPIERAADAVMTLVSSHP
jgi:lipid-A-disaccharide synthase